MVLRAAVQIEKRSGGWDAIAPTINGKDLDDEPLWPFYAKAQEMNMPILVHPVNTGPMPGGWSLTRHYTIRGYE
jgi:predicted TIM-barrel fold metal-dependent hydrolase